MQLLVHPTQPHCMLLKDQAGTHYILADHIFRVILAATPGHQGTPKQKLHYHYTHRLPQGTLLHVPSDTVAQLKIQGWIHPFTPNKVGHAAPHQLLPHACLDHTYKALQLLPELSCLIQNILVLPNVYL